MRMVAGPNGSGKSTLLDWLSGQGFNLGLCLNPDALEATLRMGQPVDFGAWGLRVTDEELAAFVDGHSLFAYLEEAPLPVVNSNRLIPPAGFSHGYYVAILCDFMRSRWIEKGISFTFETVMSGADKLDLLQRARSLGYRNYLYYICTEPPELNIARIENRVASGGHDVPEEKAKSRYLKSLSQVWEATCLVDRAYMFDNSRVGRDALRLVAEFESNRLVAVSDDLPNWFVEQFGELLHP